MKHSVVYCTQPERGTLYFFVSGAGERHYLFGRPFRASLWKRYRFGVLLDDALDRSKCSRSDRKVCDKLFKTIPSVEKEYGVSLLRRSPKSSRRVRREDRLSDEIAA